MIARTSETRAVRVRHTQAGLRSRLAEWRRMIDHVDGDPGAMRLQALRVDEAGVAEVVRIVVEVGTRQYPQVISSILWVDVTRRAWLEIEAGVQEVGVTVRCARRCPDRATARPARMWMEGSTLWVGVVVGARVQSVWCVEEVVAQTSSASAEPAQVGAA